MNYAVNLLPVHLRPKTGIDTKHVVTGALIGVILVCGGLLGFQLWQEQRTQRELSNVNREIRLLQPFMQQVRKNKDLQAQIDARTAVLAQLEKQRPVKWSSIILQLGQVVPDNLWLTELSNDTEGNITIKGGTDDIDKVSIYAKNLQRLTNIANVSFLNLAQTNINEKAANSQVKAPEKSAVNIFTYNLSIRLKGGAQ